MERWVKVELFERQKQSPIRPKVNRGSVTLQGLVFIKSLLKLKNNRVMQLQGAAKSKSAVKCGPNSSE